MSSRTDGPNPWPDPDDRPGDRVAGDAAQADPWAASEEGANQPGSRGTALAVAGLQLGTLLIVPAVLVVAIYVSITVYAIVKAVSSGSDSPDPATVLIGVVALVTIVVVLLATATWAIGRAFDPKKPRP